MMHTITQKEAAAIHKARAQKPVDVTKLDTISLRAEASRGNGAAKLHLQWIQDQDVAESRAGTQ